MIEFFKRLNLYNKEIFDYLIKNTIEVEDENISNFVGCFPVIKNNMLKEIRIIIPKQTNFKNMLIIIHEYTHAIEIYKYLNKEYVEEANPEIYPMLFERLYAIKNGLEDEYLSIQKNNVDNIKNKKLQQKYKQALIIQEELLQKKEYRRIYEK